jgi:predicted thioesterase
MNDQLKEGLSYTAKQIVTVEQTAAYYGSGLLEVFATPAMIALMENAAVHAVKPFLPEGAGTVGIAVHIEHVKATPIGQEVEATATLVKIDGKRLYFNVEARDQAGEIGKGTHVRYRIDNEKFMSKLK